MSRERSGPVTDGPRAASTQVDRLRSVCYKVPMPSATPCARRLRFRRGAFLAAALAVALSCSSDPDGPVGSDLDLLGSEPGDVFQDTIAVHADTVFQYNTMIATDSALEFGRSDGYTRAIIINISFTGAALDAGRVVESANLRLVGRELTGVFPARFYRLQQPYKQDSTMSSLDTLAVIPDPASGSVERSLQTFPPTYPLPPDLVQGWVRNDTMRTAIAILYTDDVNDRIATFKSLESARDKPQIQVNYVGGFSRVFYADSDGIFVRPIATTSNLIIADGYVRRTYFRVRLDELADQSAVHTARVRFHLVPGSLLGSNTTAVVYIPDSSDPTSGDFRSGQLVTNVDIFDGDTTVDFRLTNSIFLTLQGTLQDNGFVIRLDGENSAIRQVEFYGSSAPDTLRPRVFITSSTPATFDP